MINLFRKTRKKMAVDNKPMKYLRYAIGEIVLVVIGILIALYINNWNEDRKDLKKERRILANINSEFKRNYSLLKKHKNQYKEVRNVTNMLMSIIGQSESELLAYNLDSLMSKVINIDK